MSDPIPDELEDVARRLAAAFRLDPASARRVVADTLAAYGLCEVCGTDHDGHAPGTAGALVACAHARLTVLFSPRVRWWARVAGALLVDRHGRNRRWPWRWRRG